MPVYVGVDFHVKTQSVCWMDTADGEIHQQTLDHQRQDVAAFYRQWDSSVTVGVEASGYAQWFHRLVEERGHRLLVGDAHAIRHYARRRQKNDRRDGNCFLICCCTAIFRRCTCRRRPVARCWIFCITGSGWCGCARC